MYNQEVYLDSNATTRVLPVAAQAAFEAMEISYGNPSSSHISGLKAKYIMENARTAAKTYLGIETGDITFTCGATEGIQTAVVSALWHAKKAANILPTAKLLYGATEHKAVPETLKHWNELLGIHADILAIPVNNKGHLNVDFIKQHGKEALMICTMAANNETGVYQDLSKLEAVIRTTNPQTKWLVDCVQAMGKMPLNLANTSIDYAVFSGHKLYAPKGIGLFYVRNGAPYTPFIAGGGQERGLRSGTENLPGIAAIGAILNLLNDKTDLTFKPVATLQQYRQQLAQTLEQSFTDVVFNNDFALSLPTTINFSVPHLSAKEIMDLFDAANIRVSSGSACSSKVTGSFVLDAMGLEQWQSEGAIRMSFGPASTAKEIDHACQRIKQAVAALTSSCIISSTDDMEKGELDGLIQLHHNGACCWIIADKASKQCIVIDPLEHLAERIEKMVLCRHYSVVAIIDTHSHADHDSCREMLTTVLAHSMVQGLVDEQGWPVAHNLVTLEQGQAAQAITIGNNMLVKLATPGHTNDSISLLLGPSASSLRRNEVAHAFVGDLILIGGLGRTDFGISSAASFYHSINALSSAITPDTILCTSHDYNAEFTTTLAIESAEHGLLAKVLNGELNEAEFMAEKLQLDDNIFEQQRQAKVLMCGALSTGTVDTQGINLAPALAKTYVNAHPEAIILDVREAHEFKLQNIERVGNVQNIPPSRFTGFMAQLMKNHSKDQELICICRSGSRSEVVAKNLRRLGFENTRHVQGGMALYSVD